MNLERIYAIMLRQWFLIQRNKVRYLNIFGWIAIDIILWGFITRYLDLVGSSAFSFTTVLLGAVVLWNFLVRVHQGVIVAFFEDMWSRNFLNLFASPLSIKEYVVGLIATSIVTSLAGLTLMFFIAYLLFAFSIFQLGMIVVPFLAILMIFGWALGIFTTALVLRFGPPAEWFGWIIPFALSPFAGVFYPIASLPHGLQVVARFLPPSYVFEGMRAALTSGEFLTGELFIGLGIAAVYLSLAYLVFLATYRVILRKGLITRFTAENG
ncbi:MAG: ABC transporter permease [Parcubacteria group bacterium]|nr:ABC transporter permease [Parcubacteria group bacterium]